MTPCCRSTLFKGVLCLFQIYHIYTISYTECELLGTLYIVKLLSALPCIFIIFLYVYSIFIAISFQIYHIYTISYTECELLGTLYIVKLLSALPCIFIIFLYVYSIFIAISSHFIPLKYRYVSTSFSFSSSIFSIRFLISCCFCSLLYFFFSIFFSSSSTFAM